LPRWSLLLLPFELPLSIVAQRRAIMVLRNLFSYLQDQAYLVGNAWSHITVPNSAVPRMNVGRAFTQAQWRFANERAAALPETSATLRLRFALALLYATGLRISEAVAAQVDQLQWVEYVGEGDEHSIAGFELEVIGKGDKLRKLPVPDDVIALLGQYLVSRRLKADPRDIGNGGAFLIGRLVDGHLRAPNLVAESQDGRLGITAATLAEQLKDFFEDCGRALRDAGDVRSAERFERATVHWRRHTSASHALASGDIPLVAMKDLLGHASLSTTSAYVTTEDRQRMAAVQKFARRRQPTLPPGDGQDR
jgi:site-specific recombinase XerD